MSVVELIQMVQLKEPMMIPGLKRSTENLNGEYLRLFHQGFRPRTVGLILEASREMAVVVMNPESLVEIFMDESTNTNQSNIVILQESCTNPIRSCVIYAPVDVVAMNVVLVGGDPDYVVLLPSGFGILPEETQSRSQAVGPHDEATPNEVPGRGVGDIGMNGSLLTVSFQTLVQSVPSGSVATVNSLIMCIVERTTAAVSVENATHAVNHEIRLVNDHLPGKFYNLQYRIPFSKKHLQKVFIKS